MCHRFHPVDVQWSIWGSRPAWCPFLPLSTLCTPRQGQTGGLGGAVRRTDTCESCKDELLVAFSCKGRGVCPSCSAKRAHVTAVHLVERVLPHVPYRQWTLSFPHRVRWVLLKDVGLLSDVLTLFLRVVFALQLRRARRQSLRGGQGRYDAPALHRTGTVTTCGVPGASASGKPHEVPRRLRSRRQTAAISGPPSR
jgi:transposase-like zinc-binding protein